jgi:hypothetical protein
MQLHLLTRLGERIVMTRAEPPSTLPGAWRDSAISQLEALARANERAAARARRRRRNWMLALGGLVLLWAVSMWRQAAEPPRVPAPLEAARVPTMAPAATAAAPLASPVATVVAGVAPTADAPDPVAAAPANAVVAAADDEAARKARALARRKAAQAQARAQQEEAQQRHQLALAAQLDAEREQQRRADAAARERAERAERAEHERRQALLLAASAPRGVADLCRDSGGWAAEQRCQERQCWKAEHRADAVCLRLRDIELARLQRGPDH